MGSKDPKGIAYIETKNLDGETNLKHKVVQKDIKKRLDNEEKVYFIKGVKFINRSLVDES